MPRWKARTWWILGLLLLLQIGAVVGFQTWAIRRDIERWEKYRVHCRTIGEDLGIKAWLPPEVPDDDNVFTHPWVIGFLASEISPQSKVVAELQPWPGLALDGYEEPAEGRSWFEGREAETAAVLQAGKERADDFKAIHEAAGRGGCQPPVDIDGSFETMSGHWTRVGDLQKMLAVHADAALASGDATTATADLEAMLRLGKHLRGRNFLLATLIGSGFELRARSIIDAGLTRQDFQAADRQRLLAAMRTRSVPEELAAVMRVERGMFIAALEGLVEETPPAGFEAKFKALLNPPARQRAANSLYYCRFLEPTLADSGSRSSWEEFDQAVRRLSHDEATPATGIANAFLILAGGPGTLLAKEDDLDQLRQRLAE